MIRPFTCVCFLAACGSGLYLYQAKHRVLMIDREIEKTVHATGDLREQVRVLHAEWTLQSDPQRLQAPEPPPPEPQPVPVADEPADAAPVAIPVPPPPSPKPVAAAPARPPEHKPPPRPVIAETQPVRPPPIIAHPVVVAEQPRPILPAPAPMPMAGSALGMARTASLPPPRPMPVSASQWVNGAGGG